MFSILKNMYNYISFATHSNSRPNKKTFIVRSQQGIYIYSLCMIDVLTPRHVALCTWQGVAGLCGKVYTACVRWDLLHGWKPCGTNTSASEQLCRDDPAMIRWICSNKDQDDSRFKYIYSSKLYDFNMDWCTDIGIEQLSNFIHVSFL